ncbi:hypothetical protein IPC1257_24640 [Pseudomonas aeruginosa]|nr:hypothetical protein IPC1257_24640 [Pseudomonas aeruginosa]RPT15427.1 hypothetical protein IPC977_28515 [Pseudomonas aeruginosa]RPT77703.1 hypothetical protein IPC935_28895 [Pseudomonas aeruginosa]
MPNHLTLAVAGGRKTQGLVDHCKALPNDRRLGEGRDDKGRALGVCGLFVCTRGAFAVNRRWLCSFSALVGSATTGVSGRGRSADRFGKSRPEAFLARLRVQRWVPRSVLAGTPKLCRLGNRVLRRPGSPGRFLGQSTTSRPGHCISLAGTTAQHLSSARRRSHLHFCHSSPCEPACLLLSWIGFRLHSGFGG